MFAIAMTVMPLHMHAPIALKSSREAVKFLLWELIYIEKQLPGIYF